MINHKPTLTRDECRALRRSVEHRAAGVQVRRLTPMTYQVQSATVADRWYTVQITSLSERKATCQCAAGSNSRPCFHCAAALDLAVTANNQAKALAPSPSLSPVRMTEAECALKMARLFPR